MTELFDKSQFFLQDIRKDKIRSWDAAEKQVADILHLLQIAFRELQKIEAQNE